MSFLKLCVKQLYNQQLPSALESKIIQIPNLTHMLTQMQNFKVCVNLSCKSQRNDNRLPLIHDFIYQALGFFPEDFTKCIDLS